MRSRAIASLARSATSEGGRLIVVIVVLALVAGVAYAAVSGPGPAGDDELAGEESLLAPAAFEQPATTSTSPTTTSTLAPLVRAQRGERSSHSVLDAGVVTVRVLGENAGIVAVRPNAGWSAQIEPDQLFEAEVTFRRGSEQVEFRSEIEDGRLRIRIWDQRTDTLIESFADEQPAADGSVTDDGAVDAATPTTTTVRAATPADATFDGSAQPADDENSDDDRPRRRRRRGDNRDDDDDDDDDRPRRRRGGGGDDDDDDDDD